MAVAEKGATIEPLDNGTVNDLQRGCSSTELHTQNESRWNWRGVVSAVWIAPMPVPRSDSVLQLHEMLPLGEVGGRVPPPPPCPASYIYGQLPVNLIILQ